MVVKRFFFTWNLNKEIDWLNKMSEKGYHLSYAGFGVYSFEEDKGKKYIYDIQSLNFFDAKGKDEDYIDFLAENNITKISKVFDWYYFRKEKVGDNDVVLFSDLNSKIDHLTSIIKEIGVLFLINFLFWITNFIHVEDYSTVFFSFARIIQTGAVFILGFCLYKLQCSKKKLQEEKQIKE